jgi:tetratricopeptide (TPR) repeat protein
MYGDVVLKVTRCTKCADKSEFEPTIQYITKQIEDCPTNPDFYFIRGDLYFKKFKFSSAMSDFLKVVELDPENLEAYYAVASNASLSYNKAYAIHWLQKAIESGFDDYERISADPTLAFIRNTKEFKRLIAKLSYKLSSTSQK